MPKRRKDEHGNEILTTREELFVEHVAQGKSLTQAALDAGYSPRTADKIGTENRSKPVIDRAVQARIQNVVKADTDEVMQLFAAHLRGDVADFADLFLEDGRIDLHRAKELGISRLIKKLDYEPVELVFVDRDDDGAKTFVTRYRCKVEFHDSQSAASKLADIMGIKQQPRANEHDAEQRRREMAADQLQTVMEKLGLERDAAIVWLRENVPAAAQWIN